MTAQLIEIIKNWHQDVPIIIGLNAPPGSGKTTLCAKLADSLTNEHGLKTLSLSIDDFYKTKDERLTMAEHIHPLFKTRGVPGTHDINLAIQTLTQLQQAKDEDFTPLPQFSKNIDDRLPKDLWPVWQGSIDIILFEGWCVGSIAQTDEELIEPINDLERLEDPDMIWRRTVNKALKEEYPPIFKMIDYLITLSPPSFDIIYDWRLEQEQNHNQSMAPDEVNRFLAHYERLIMSNFNNLLKDSNLCVNLSDDHSILEIMDGEA